MSQDTENNGDSYKFYLLGTSTPVRITFNEGGLKVGAETVDHETGELVFNNSLLNRVETSSDVEEITEEDFEQQVKKNECSPTVA